MTHYLVSLHTVQGQAREPMTEAQMQQSSARIAAVEADMRAAGAWVFSGRLHGPDTATVVHPGDGEVLVTDGPFAESKEHLAGFYIIEAEDLDGALGWAARTSAAVGAPIEVRPFMDVAKT
ncbi:MAG: YciI family protein [Cellulomonas sp.]